MSSQSGIRAGLFFAFVLSCAGYASFVHAEPGDEVCFPLYRNANAIPGTQQCEPNANGAGVGLGTFYCTSQRPRILRYCGTLPRKPATCDSADVGHPIDTSTGNKHLEEIDFESAEAFPMRIERYYNSMPFGLQKGAFGVNWRFTYDRYFADRSSSVYIARADGSISYFQLSGGKWVQIGNGRDRLIEVKNSQAQRIGWDLTIDADDSVEHFDASGLLTSITDRRGLTHTITRSTTSTPSTIAPGPGYIIAVTSSFGRQIKFTWNSRQYIHTVETPSGTVFTYGYDSKGRLYTVTYPSVTTPHPVRTFIYGELDHTANQQQDNALTGIIDENAKRLATYDYDVHGRAFSTQYAGGADHYTIRYTTDADDATISSALITDPIGTNRTYHFVGSAGARVLQSVDQPGGSGCVAASNSRGYDNYGNVASRTNFNGVKTTFTYDTTRNLEFTRTVADGTPDALITTTQWHSKYRLPVLITEPKRKTVFTYYDNGNLKTKTVQATTDLNGSLGDKATVQGAPRTWSYTYDANGQLKSITGPRTDVVDKTTYDYDAAGNLILITNALDQKTILSDYDADGRVGRIEDPNGLVTTLKYWPRGWLKSKTVGTEMTTYDYDDAGQLKQVKMPDGSFVNYGYDDAHRLTDITDSLGNAIQYKLDFAGNRKSAEVKDPKGVLSRSVTRDFDALNRVYQVTGDTQ